MAETPTQPGSQAPGPSAPKPDKTSGTEVNAAGERDSIRELLDALSRTAPKLERENADLARRAEAIVRQAAEPGRSTQPQFRHDIAYLVQDIERSAIGQLPLTVTTQSEVTRLAGSAPGLENERMLSLMRSTASIDDRGLVRDIRRAGAGIGREIDQNTPNVRSQIESLENRVRLTARPADAAPEAQPGDSHVGTAPAAAPRRPAGHRRRSPNAKCSAAAALARRARHYPHGHPWTKSGYWRPLGSSAHANGRPHQWLPAANDGRT